MKHYKAQGSVVGFNSTLFTESDTLENKWVVTDAIIIFEGRKMKLDFTYDKHHYQITGPLFKNLFEAEIICDHKLSGELTALMYSNDKGFILLGSWVEGFMLNEVWGRFEWVDKKEIFTLKS